MSWWLGFPFVVLGMSLATNVCLVWMIRDRNRQEDPLIEEMRGANEILRDENRSLYERITTMAASVPHIRLAGSEQETYDTHSPLEITDDDGTVIGHKGAGVV